MLVIVGSYLGSALYRNSIIVRIRFRPIFIRSLDILNPLMQLFPTYAFNSNNATVVRVKGWAFKKSHSLRNSTADPFLSGSVKCSPITITIGSQVFSTATGNSGIFTFRAEVNHQNEGDVIVTAFCDSDTSSAATITVPIISATGLSIVSDVDDTIKDSMVYKSKIHAIAKALFKKPQEVPGMANAYNYLSAKGCPIHYVSSGPFKLTQYLLDFIQEFGFPRVSLALRDNVWTEKTIDYKTRVIREIINVFLNDLGSPQAHFCAKTAQISIVFIRQVDGKSLDALRARAKAAFSPGVADLNDFAWQGFKDPMDILSNDILQQH